MHSNIPSIDGGEDDYTTVGAESLGRTPTQALLLGWGFSLVLGVAH